ncbi:uncharacterized protein [Ptychodera flava]|uniref:uncharacterized protein n=1 Tax=Ptychodera flava TaxID=63121 RepID=UPI00396A1909
MKRIRERNLTLNRQKCKFSKSIVVFYGHVFGGGGVSPDPKKVEALQEASEPQSVAEVKSLLGMANYCGRFIPNLATISEPLRELTKKDTPWQWGKRQKQALKQIKEEITSNCDMAYLIHRYAQSYW